MKVVASVRAAVGPTSVQDPQHPLCLACGRPHRLAAFIPLPARRSSPPRRSTITRSRLLLDLAGIRPVLPSLAAPTPPFFRKGGRASRPDRDMKASSRRNVNGSGDASRLCFSGLPSTPRRAVQESRTGAPQAVAGTCVRSGAGVSAGVLRVDAVWHPCPAACADSA